MKKANFLFVILIVAAAVITGSTIAIASNFDLLVAQANQTQVVQSDKIGFQLDELEKIPELSESEFDQVLTQFPEQDISNEAFSQHEQKQVLEMLYALGMVNGNNYNEFILDLQKKHKLEPTGELDSQTLSLILEQFKLKKANNSP